MRATACLFLTWMMSVLAASTNLAAECEEGFTPIFNGKDLTGWEGIPGYWSVEDGYLTGTTTAEKPLARSTYLFWNGGELANFELRATYRFVGSFGNSGINFRSQRLKDWDVKGYQGDMETGPAFTGVLFDVKRQGSQRNWNHQILTKQGQKVMIAEDGTRTVTTLTPAKELQQIVRQNDWNEYVVIARGAEIILKVNGAVFAHVIDQEKGISGTKGILALQLHRGPPMKVQFKSLRIRQLPL